MRHNRSFCFVIFIFVNFNISNLKKLNSKTKKIDTAQLKFFPCAVNALNYDQ